jgi:hypothetical protein
MGRMAREFAKRDVADVGLWVFHRNVTAVVFARSLGAVVTGSRDDEQGAGNTELALIWPKASDLALFDDGQHGPMQHSPGRSLGMMPLAPCISSSK